MPPYTFVTTNYEAEEGPVSWRGLSMADGSDFNTFMTTDVASRLNDEEGTQEFESCLRSLPSTNFGQESVEKILTARIPEEREWVIGEAFAEAYLEGEHGIIFPWNMERDKRTPKASLPGADLVGFEINGSDAKLVLGEVKTSADANTPPSVMNGRHGMTHQIDKLANNLALISGLLFWLWFRC